MLSEVVKKQWKKWVNQVPVIVFNNGKCDLHMMKKYCEKEIGFTKEHDCNEDVFAAKKKNNYMLLTASKFTF